MDTVEIIALSMGVAWASGINLYAAILMLGIMGATGNLALPADLEILSNYVLNAPPDRALVTLQRYQIADGATPEIITVFLGEIATVKFERGALTAKIICEPDIRSLSREIPRYTFQSLCNNDLYDGFCQVSKTLSTGAGGRSWKLDGTSLLR